VILYICISGFRSRAFAVATLFLSLVCGAHSLTLQGDWQGEMTGPNGSLPIVFHLDADGGGTVDSPAQKFSSPLRYKHVDTGTHIEVLITVSSIKASYAATVDGNKMSGKWSQNGDTVPLNVTKADAAGPGGGSSTNTAIPEGDWQGTLVAPNGRLPVVFHLGVDGSGTIDIPAQRFNAALEYSLDGSRVTIIVSSINMTYAATINGNRMAGTWSQNGQQVPLKTT
jgi:hypothetical protein